MVDVAGIGMAYSLAETNFYQFKRVSYTRYVLPVKVKYIFYVIAVTCIGVDYSLVKTNFNQFTRISYYVIFHLY